MRQLQYAQPMLVASGVVIAVFSTAEAAFGGEPRTLPEFAVSSAIESGARLMQIAHSDDSGQLRATLDRIDVIAAGTSDRQAQQAARAALPINQLSPENRRRMQSVLDNVSMFRAMPTLRMEVDHGVYRYFMAHPDVAVSIWRAMDVSKCELWQTGPDSYETDIGDGSVGTVDVLLRSDTDQLIYGEGLFKSPLLVRPIRANALMHVRTQYLTAPDGKTETICRGTLFVTFPSQTVETAAKVISPVTNMVIDRNFEEIGLFVHMMTLAMRNQPGWVENIAGQLDGVLDRRRPELLEVTARAYVAHRKRVMGLDEAASPSNAAPVSVHRDPAIR